jgi:hypothetical protein
MPNLRIETDAKTLRSSNRRSCANRALLMVKSSRCDRTFA